MHESILREYYQEKGFSEEATQAALQALERLASFLAGHGKTLETASAEDIRDHIQTLCDCGMNTPDELLALARTFYLTGKKEIYIDFTALLNSRGVVGVIRDRLRGTAGKAAADAAFARLEMPPLGTPPSAMPAFTRRLMAGLSASLPREDLCRLLAGNNHEIPAEAFLEEKQRYEQAASLDDFLTDQHRRNVAELQEYCDRGEIWFEQVITQEVVDFVAADPEIQSAVRVGNKLYTTKIPFDTVRTLHAETPEERRFHLCHCPFVRHTLLNPGEPVNPDWCYCSAGFVKFPYEVIFGQELKVELLESPLLGHDRCRFAITLPGKVTERTPY